MKKKSLIATLIAAPILSLSSMAFAAEPMTLNASQMDSVTAGDYDNIASIGQINVSPVVVAQINVLNFGFASNSAEIYSGNWSNLYQNY